MSFFNKLKEGFNSGRAELTKQVSRFKNKNLCKVRSQFVLVSLLPAMV